jgi:hypothetical protein
VPTGNSDSHKLFLEEAGFPRTFVHAAAAPRAGREQRVQDALKRGDVAVSSGPLVVFTVNGVRAGSTIKLRAGEPVKVDVKVYAPAWVPFDSLEIFGGDELLQHWDAPQAVDGLRLAQTVTLRVSKDTALFAWASAKAPLPYVLAHPNVAAIGFSGLVYVDADGDDKLTLPPAM